jgi:hypothetical protein
MGKHVRYPCEAEWLRAGVATRTFRESYAAHLHSIFGKLGVNSRSQLTCAVMSHVD